MAKAIRKAKLKVFSTPIGFHDALVAAPSQKAALEAWGAGTDLFSQGSAHIVTDPKLTKLPLEHPGQVVKVLRGTRSEQLAALSMPRPPARRQDREMEVVPERPKTRAPKPSRTALARAEQALEKLEKRHSGQLAKLEKEQGDLDRRVRETRRRLDRERDKAQEKVDDERRRYAAAIDRYESG